MIGRESLEAASRIIHAETGITTSDAMMLLCACDPCSGLMPDGVRARHLERFPDSTLDLVEEQLFRQSEIERSESKWPPNVKRFFEVHPDWLPYSTSDVPRGWDQHVAEALNALWDLQFTTGLKVRLAQVKQKWGGLRLYVDTEEMSAGGFEIVLRNSGGLHMRNAAKPGSVREKIHGIVDRAAQRCSETCETCGAKGHLRRRAGYVFVACDDHGQGSRSVGGGTTAASS